MNRTLDEQPFRLSATYDAVRREVQAAIELKQRLTLPEMKSKSDRALQKALVKLLPPSDLFENSLESRNAVRARAKPEDWGNPLLDVVSARYFVEALAKHVTDLFHLTVEQANALAALHDERDKQEQAISSFFRLKWLKAAIATVAAALATQVPKESFSVLGLSEHAYGVYRLVVFGLLVAALFYLVAAPAVLRRALRKDADAATFYRERDEWPRLSSVTRLVLIECSLVESFPELDTDAGSSRSHMKFQ